MKSTMFLLVLFLTACTSASNNDVQPGDADRAIARQNASFTAALHAGDVERLMNFYADSAVVLPPNAPAMTGRDAVRQFWSGFLGGSNVEASLLTDNVVQSCDMAAERGHYDLTMTPKQGGAPMHDIGKYVVVWRKMNGQWRAVDDIFNSNMPSSH